MIKTALMKRRSDRSKEDTINMILNTGQSLSDEVFPGDTIVTMSELGIENPGYSEQPFPGQPFRNWCTSAGFNSFITGNEAPFNVISITVDSLFVATATTDVNHFYTVKNKVVIAGADQPEYNNTHRITNVTPTTFRFNLDYQPADATGASITVKRAGCKEVWEKEINDLILGGNKIKIIGMMFMQGRGNSNLTGAPANEWVQGRNFIKLLKDYADTELSAIPDVTISDDFVISVGLTSSSGAATDFGSEEAKLRNLQINSCRYREYAYWSDTIQFFRSDGVHAADQKGLHSRQIETIINRDNRRVPSSQFGLT